MTEAELKAHIDVLSVAVATLAVQATQTSQVTEALDALVQMRPSLAGATGEMKATLKQAEEDRAPAAQAKIVGIYV